VTCEKDRSSVELGVASSEVSSSDGNPSGSSSMMPSASECSESGSQLRLCIPMSATSTPSPDRATSSPEAFPASRFHRPGSGSARMTRATCGHTPFAYWSNQERRWDSSRTCLDFSARDTSEPFSETWPRRGSMRNGACWEQTMSVPRIEGSDCGYWPSATATTRECTPAQGEERREQQGGTLRSTYLQDAVKYQVEERTYPTPKGSPSGPDFARASRPGSGGDDLATAIARGASTPQTWGTPTARDHKDCGTMENVPENALLGRQVLNRQEWQTPSKACADGGQTSRGGDRTNELLLTGQAQAASGTSGSLNPTWVEWLMGWPRGWTDCEHSVTDRCLRQWQRRSCTWAEWLGYLSPEEEA